MADVVFNIAKGRVAELAALAAANDALIGVPLLSAGLVSDATMIDYTTLAAVLAGASDEATGGNWSRKTLSNVVVTPDNTNNWQSVTCDPIIWAAPHSGPASGKLLVCWDGDITGGTDSNILPLVALDFAATPAGGSVTYTPNAAGFYRAA